MPPAALRPPRESPRAPPSGLRELDALAQNPASHGLITIQAPRRILEAAAHHAERRARAQSRAVLSIDGQLTDDPWRELTARIGALATTDALSAARSILDATDVVILLDLAPTAWGTAVSRELARLTTEDQAPRPLILLLVERADPATPGRVIDIEATVTPAERSLFWQAIAGDADRQISPGLDRLDTLHAWWTTARATPPDRRPEPPALSPEASRLLARLLLSQRSWSLRAASELGSSAACAELLAVGGLVEQQDGRLAATSDGGATATPSTADARIVAAALDALPDAWAAARASELHALAGDPARAEAAAVRALGAFVDPAARADFWRRWEASLEALARGAASEGAASRLLRAAELALRIGDLDRAHDLASKVGSPRGDAFDALLTRGRVYVARGDVSTGEFVLGKALECAPDAAARARAAVEMAEVKLLAGELDAARLHAAAGLAEAGDPATRLLARNVLGKLTLAAADWDAAERHFAADACEASLSGDLVAELRARLNRAIALLSSGRHHEARVMLGAVLEEGERHGEVRAIAFALSNLATIATLQRDYAEALRLSERVLEVRRRIGDKLSLALLITNLAYLRLRIGQVAEAEQALRFGRRACGPGMPATRVAHFAIVAARIHLARGNTLEATTELREAIAGSRSSRDGNKLSECYRVEARVALEDGDTPRVAAALTRAREAASSSIAQAEIALLEAMRARAAGEPFMVLAREALELARAADDTELATEAHLVLHHAASAAGDARGARLHFEGALALRNRIAEALPEDMRRSFFERREIRELGTSLEPLPAPASAPSSEPQSRAPVPSSRAGAASLRPALPPTAASRKIVGRDPAILALLNAVQKIGPSDATVLIHGESGTGKELVAEAIHEASARRAGPLVKVNCAALVETLLLSELFGHEKGSFTGASTRKRGRFELAEGGTIFLDEIGDIPLTTQVALLRVLQEKTFERVGGVTSIQANVRILCATHRDLRGMVARGEFREDLYYRLRGLVLEVPTLRQRPGDLPAIAAAILARLASERGTPEQRLSPRALEALEQHPWPGNVRELENALRAAALFADGDQIEIADFTSNVEGLRHMASTEAAASSPVLAAGAELASDPTAVSRPSANERIGDAAGSSPTDAAYAHVRGGVSLSDMKRQIERDCIARALAESGGNITRAAALLGMKRPRLSQLVKQYGFGVDAFGADADSEEM